MVEDIPDDPDEAMAWLERLAARQGASVDELPSLADVDADIDEDVEAPDWLADELEAAEEEVSDAEDDVVYSEAVGEIDDTLYEDIDIAEGVEPEAPEAQEEATPFDEDEHAQPEALEDISAEAPEEADTLSELDFATESLEEDLPDWLDLDEEEDLEAFDWEEPAFAGSDWLEEEEPVADVEPAEEIAKPEEPLEAEAEMQAQEIEALDAEDEAAVEEPQPSTELPADDVAEPGPAIEETAYEEMPYEEVSYFEEVEVSEEAAEEVAEGAAPLAEETAVEEAAVEEAAVAEPAEVELEADAQQAWQALEAGNVDEALDTYKQLLDAGSAEVTTLIEDLERATESLEDNPRLMQLLGDAYNQNGQLQKALDAYRQALEML